MSKRSMEIHASASTAEMIVTSPAFKKANDAPYVDEDNHLSVTEVYDHSQARDAATNIIFDAFLNRPRSPQPEQHWEMQRQAALAKLGGASLGSFNDFFLRLPSEAQPATEDSFVYDSGMKDVVDTNTSIVRMRLNHLGPISFMEQAMGYVEQRKKSRKTAVGPENYATALKLFADKYAELDDESEVDLDHVRELAEQGFDGFFEIAKSDKPNPIEITNIYATIRKLPAGMFDAKHTKALLEHTVTLLPDSDPLATASFVKALPKLELGENGEIAAEVLSLVLRKNKKFEHTTDLRDTVRAISVLPKSLAADRAIAAMFEYRNDTEQALDLESADEIMYRFKNIANNVVGTNELYTYLKTLAESAGRAAFSRVKDGHREGIYSQDQFRHVQQTLQRIKTNYEAI